jgi:hypothetical protein
MKRFGVMFGAALMALTMVGCDGGGIQEGTSSTAAGPGGAPPGFREEMEKNSKNMALKKGRPKTAPPAAAPAAPEKPAQ